MVAATKATSWAVAAGVAAVEALKDQAGLCRWNYALKNLQQHAKNSFGSSTAKSSCSLPNNIKSGGGNTANNTANQARKFSGVVDHSTKTCAVNKREAEKAENVMHLVCWGPK